MATFLHDVSGNSSEASNGKVPFPHAPLPLDKPVSPHKIRFVCISDTHNQLDVDSLPPGNVLLHAGDFSYSGKLSEILMFNEQMGRVNFRYKLVIAGNHELTFYPPTVQGKAYRMAQENLKELAVAGIKDPRSLLTNCTYLEDEQMQVPCL